MTETEIMKALECCAFDNCRSCTADRCVTFMDAVNIIDSKNAEIKRKNDEIDRLTAVEESHREQNGELRKEVERLKEELLESNIEIAELYKCKFSAEDVAQNIIRARKEFAEKIYRSCAMYGQKDKFNKTVFLNIVDQIAKEMGVEL